MTQHARSWNFTQYILSGRKLSGKCIRSLNLLSVIIPALLCIGIPLKSHSQTVPETFDPGWIRLDTTNTPVCGMYYVHTVKWRFPTLVSTSGDTIVGSIRFTFDVYQDGKLFSTLPYNIFNGRKDAIEDQINFIYGGAGDAISHAGYDFSISAILALPGYPTTTPMIGTAESGIYPGINNDHFYSCPTFYSKPSGDLSNASTWGKNTDGSGDNPLLFNRPNVFKLANRGQKYFMTSNWNVGELTIPSNSQLEVNGFALRTERVNSVNGTGTISGTSASDWTIGGPGYVWVTPGAGDFNNFTVENISGQASLNAPVNIYGTLTLHKAGNLVSLNADNLVLKSTARSTASVAQILNTSNQVVPDMPLTIERFIPAKRAWRLLCAPLAMSQTVSAAWQEGKRSNWDAYANPNPGYGTLIFGGSPLAGFDYNYFHHGSQPVSLKKYNSPTDTWIPVPNTNATPVGNMAYMLFVRSNRGTEPFKEYGSENTVLRARGYLNCNDQTFTVEKNGFTAIPNPYASAINFATITRSNVQNNFYVWDPKLGGANGVGGYVLISFNGTGYDVIPAAVSEESQYIQSGQAFLVHSNGNAGSITIKESDKVSVPTKDVFRTTADSAKSPISSIQSNSTGLRVTLQSLENDNKTAVLDEVFSSYSPAFSDKLDKFDAEKMENVEENIAIVKDGHNLMAERSAALDRDDIVQLKIWNIKPQTQYQLEINADNIERTISTAFLTDNYLKTKLPIDLTKPSHVQFFATTEDAASNANRFSISFQEKTEFITAESGISTFPNPVNRKSIQLKMENQPKGNYKVQLYNSASQLVFSTIISHPGGTTNRQIQFPKMPVPGKYFLQVASDNSTKTLQIIVE